MESSLHVARPSQGTIVPPTNVVIQAQALFQILDQAIRHQGDQTRVIGTLLGVRSEDGLEVEVRSAYTVPHNETDDQVVVGVDYNRSMYALHRRAHPREVILGWFSTSSELNNLSGLMHDFYSQSEGTYPHPAIHLTVQAGSAIDDIDVRTYISSPVGVGDKTVGSCLFVPIPNEVRYSEAEKKGAELLVKARDSEDRTVDLTSDIRALEKSILELIDMVERVSAYVSRVSSGAEVGDSALGKFLLRNLSLVPSVSGDKMEKLFNSHLQDVLMVVYLSNTIKTQLQLYSRLTPIV
uniref:Eukaryotic translation initiation factor 3 subunit F n=1 Tax=Blastobotrys adeninivorans TaxID=409370 RepID=A0A060T5B9_BLAAD